MVAIMRAQIMLYTLATRWWEFNGGCKDIQDDKENILFWYGSRVVMVLYSGERFPYDCEGPESKDELVVVLEKMLEIAKEDYSNQMEYILDFWIKTIKFVNPRLPEE